MPGIQQEILKLNELADFASINSILLQKLPDTSYEVEASFDGAKRAFNRHAKKTS